MTPVINTTEDADKLGVRCCANCDHRQDKDKGLCEDVCNSYDKWMPIGCSKGYCGTVAVGGKK
jgi:hypothetical protein